MIVVGLTGSIGMGKSTVTQMFADEGAVTWNADEAVHRLYAKGGAGVPAVGGLFPEAISDGAVNRGALSRIVLGNQTALEDLEAIIHPLVSADRSRFLADAVTRGAEIAILDIPLLFEKGYAEFFDVIIVVSASADIQKARVLARPGMSEEKFCSILSRQIPDEEKRRRADYIIDTGVALEKTRAQVRTIAAELKESAGGK
ncbi:MAG: dephospho-CoA kinase [Parvularculaceae bacterium]|nr:dephospho-CoA kinase [Parvularculaceae bacterium]